MTHHREPTEALVYVPPYLVGLVLADNVLNITSVLNMAALAVVLAGVFVVARYKAALSAVEASAQAWQTERDAALARADRITEELVKAASENAALKSRPDLIELTELVRGQGDKIDTMADRIVAAIKATPQTKGGAT